MNSGHLEFIKEGCKNIKVPNSSANVCKSEGCLSFAAPMYSGGLYTNLETYQAFGDEYLELDHKNTKTKLYLHQKWDKVATKKKDDKETKKKPTKMQIGGEDGFDIGPTWEWQKKNSLMLMPRKHMLPFPNLGFPKELNDVKNAILEHKAAAPVVSSGFDATIKESKYAKSLVQVEVGDKKISSNPKDWKCESTGATNNLWLNLSDGFIGDGRPQYGTDLGGTGTALKHYKETNEMYPLVVKLGTITPKGADVYSYASDEDNMVIDPKLAEHLAHWGINMMKMEKTEMSMEEMQVEYNLTASFDRVLEAGVELEAVTGPGYVGLTNIGSSCYMNSLLQVLLAIPEFADYYNNAKHLTESPKEPSKDFTTQMAKVAIAVLADSCIKSEKNNQDKEKKYMWPACIMSDEDTASSLVSTNGTNGTTTTTTTTTTTSTSATTSATTLASGALASTGEVNTAEDETLKCPMVVRPQMFRDLVGKGHEDFSTSGQQDVFQYYQHFLSILEKEDRIKGSKANLHPLFTFAIEERIQCSASKKVKYKKTEGENIFALPLATDKGTVVEVEAKPKDEQAKKIENDEPPLLNIPFEECVKLYCQEQLLDNFYSTETKKKGKGTKTTRFATFPKYLVMQVQRFYVAPDWTTKKLQHRISVPDKFNFSMLASTGLQEGESLLPQEEKSKPVSSGAIEPDMNMVAQLMPMGFSENACKRACIAKKNSNAEACLEWIMQHMSDPNLNSPLDSADGGGGAQDFPEEDLNYLINMGFDKKRSKYALKKFQGNKNNALNWVLAEPDAPIPDEPEVKPKEKSEPEAAPEVLAEEKGDGKNTESGNYELVSFITHMGPNSGSGHYVCHIKKEGKWTIFNDAKVNRSQKPTLDLGYLYFFRQIN